MNYDRPFNNRRSFAPVNVGDVIDLKIEAVGEKGDGIAKIKGFVIFVPGVKEGDEVKVKITKVLQKVGFGEVVGDTDGPVQADDQAGDSGDEAEQEAPAEEAGEAEEPKDAGEEAPVDEGEEPKDSEDF
tara:strand:- start:21093 stop:21479 length:387 start_codon:yes stop_codon:yes gene_type:complete